MPFPDGYEVVNRPSDGERVGFVAPSGDGWLPLNLIGFQLGDTTDHAAAVDKVVATGLASIDGQWWCRAPLPFAITESELLTPDPSWSWRIVVVVEVNSLTCSIRPAMPWPEEQGRTVVLTLPIGDLLRREQPDE